MSSESAGRHLREYLRERDTWTAVEWTVPLVAFVVGAVNLYAGAVTGDGAFTVIGGSFFASVLLYFSVYWQPVLYLLVVLYVLTLGAFWVFAGLPLLGLGAVNGVLNLCLVTVCVYLYVRYAEEGDAK